MKNGDLEDKQQNGEDQRKRGKRRGRRKMKGDDVRRSERGDEGGGKLVRG